MTMTGTNWRGLSLKFDIRARRFALDAFGCIEIEHSFGVSISVAQRRKGWALREKACDGGLPVIGMSPSF